MALPLKDFRCGITESIDMWLGVVADRKRKDKAHIARTILQEWANEKMAEWMLYKRRAAANGLQPDLPGFDTEDDGLELEDAGVGRSPPASRGGRR